MKPNFADAYYRRGLAKKKLEKYKQAIEDLSKAGELRNKQAYKKIEERNRRGKINNYLYFLEADFSIYLINILVL